MSNERTSQLFSKLNTKRVTNLGDESQISTQFVFIIQYVKDSRFMQSYRFLLILCILSLGSCILTLPSGIQSGLLNIFTTSSSQPITITYSESYSQPPLVGYFMHSLHSPSIKALVTNQSILLSSFTVTFDVRLRQTNKVMFGVRYAVSRGEPFQVARVSILGSDGEKSENQLGGFRFSFGEATKRVKYDVAIAGIQYREECAGGIRIQPDWLDQDYQDDYEDYISKIESKRPYDAELNKFFTLQLLPDCLVEVQISIIAHTIHNTNSDISSGFTKFLFFSRTQQTTRAMNSSIQIYDKVKNNLGSFNSALIYGLNQLSLIDLFFQMSKHNQSSLILTARYKPPVRAGGVLFAYTQGIVVFNRTKEHSWYEFTQGGRVCGEDEVLVNTFDMGERVVQCEKGCAGDRRMYRHLQPPVCMDCNQYGANYTFDPELNKCVCDKKKGHQRAGMCICRDESYVPFKDSYQCPGCSTPKCLFCITSGICTRCIKNYVPKSSKQSDGVICAIRCKNFPHARHSFNDDEQCQCELPYTWNQSSLSCQLMCNGIPHSVGPVPDRPTQCICTDHRIWDSSLGACVLNCQAMRHTDKSKPNSAQQCSCSPKFSFDKQKSQCVLNCSRIHHSTGQSDPSNDYLCTCNSPYIFNTSSFQCDINCSLVPHSTGTTTQNGTCNCLQRFSYDNTKKQCVIDCNLVQNALSDSKKLGRCKCKNNCRWDPYKLICELRCDFIARSDRNPPINNVCRCVGDSHWDMTMMTCI